MRIVQRQRADVAEDIGCDRLPAQKVSDNGCDEEDATRHEVDRDPVPEDAEMWLVVGTVDGKAAVVGIRRLPGQARPIGIGPDRTRDVLAGEISGELWGLRDEVVRVDVLGEDGTVTAFRHLWWFWATHVLPQVACEAYGGLVDCVLWTAC